MARGVSSNALNQATQTENQNQSLYANQQQQGQALQQQFQNIVNNPGYTQAQQNSIANATMGGLNASYDALTNNAKMTAAHTNNGASYSDLLDQLARSKGSQGAQLAAQNQTNFANNAQQQQMQALGALQGLYGTNTSFLSQQSGLPVSYLNAATNANNSGFGNAFGNAFGATLGKGLGASLI